MLKIVFSSFFGVSFSLVAVFGEVLLQKVVSSCFHLLVFFQSLDVLLEDTELSICSHQDYIIIKFMELCLENWFHPATWTGKP